MGAGGVGLGDMRTDIGWITSATISKAAAVAIALKQVSAQRDISNAQLELAEKQYNLSKSLHDYWMDVFRPCEESLVAEACAQEVHTPEYLEQYGRYVNSVRTQFAIASDKATEQIGKFCVGQLRNVTSMLALQEATAVADAGNFAFRYAEARADALNDVRWSRKTQAIGLGRNLLSTQLSYSQAAANAYSSLGAQSGQSLSNALWTLGFGNQRNLRPQPEYQAFRGYQSPQVAPQYQQVGQQQPVFEPTSAIQNNAQLGKYQPSPVVSFTQSTVNNQLETSGTGYFRTNDAGTGG